jgi:hypothetical protein
MASIPCTEDYPLLDSITLESVLALQSPDEDIRIMAIRDLMFRRGLSHHPIRLESPSRTRRPTPISPPNRPSPEPRKPARFKHAAACSASHETSTTAADSPSPPASGERDFDICAIHAHLEICEIRIVNGTDKRHRHPALCIEAANGHTRLKKAEAEVCERYAVGAVAEKVPTFWPPRAWDSEKGRLTEGESRRLEQKIAEQAMGGMKSSTVEIPLTVFLDSRDYGTDGSDEDTEWEDV